VSGPKDVLTPEQYKRWLERHRVVEKARKWGIINENNPIMALPDGERGELPETFSVEEMFWHPLACECGSCLGPTAKAIKLIRMNMSPIPPAVKSVVSPLPELPRPVLHHLQVVVAEVLSKQDSGAESNSGPE